ncbi:hypothetical protein H6P81_016514 [Aristolochia fimbriata]|uniref:Uncharacterized protein n=1 Tax=Aristolochia fimbriata TaxID=158543 RepID=A0AAV7E8Y1_ARIFI|nr:hypothetical protein H6P81_016514 [Aristolochia fimbriata]
MLEIIDWTPKECFPLESHAGDHRLGVVMAATVLYDQASYRSEAIWRGEDSGCLDVDNVVLGGFTWCT